MTKKEVFNQEQKKGIKLILGGAIGDCVHVAGVFEYLRIAEYYGFSTTFLGAAVTPEKFIDAIKEEAPSVVCISYRLNPDALKSLLNDLTEKIKALELKNTLFYFGGTPSCIKVAKSYYLFSRFFQGEENITTIRESLFLEEKVKCSIQTGELPLSEDRNIKFLEGDSYYPLIRHHFGLPDLDNTISGVKELAKSGQVDIISLAPDQNAQEYFFKKEKMNESLDGSGGVPIRTEADLINIRDAACTGKFPRLKIYSGTNNLLNWAEMSLRILNVPWGTVPLFWYSELDGRSKRKLKEAIKENADAIKWYADRNIPVEINDAHQWSLRETSDVISVLMFYIAAYNAKRYGVKKYIAQLMFNTPRLTDGNMDLAKMLAKLEMIDDLVDDNFTYLKQVRAGLTHFSVDTDIAKGQLASSTLLSLAVRPHIIHVVNYSEADHAAEPGEVIEACKIVKGVLRNCWIGFPDSSQNDIVQERKEHLVTEVRKVLSLIYSFFEGSCDDPLSDPNCLVFLVKEGILDAPHLKGNSVARGEIITKLFNGGYESFDTNNHIISDYDRIERSLELITNEKKDLLDSNK